MNLLFTLIINIVKHPRKIFRLSAYNLIFVLYCPRRQRFVYAQKCIENETLVKTLTSAVQPYGHITSINQLHGYQNIAMKLQRHIRAFSSAQN
jgi:hypothetical protein